MGPYQTLRRLNDTPKTLSAVEKAEEMSKIAMAKTEEMTRISKLKFDIHQLLRDIAKENEKLGKLVYQHTKNDHMATFSGNSDFFELISKIDLIKENCNFLIILCNYRIGMIRTE